MAGTPLQSQKLIRLMQIFLQETDEEHPLTMEQLRERLSSLGIQAERKSLYQNIETLNQCGLDIVMERSGGTAYYYVASRDFETAELQLLADAVASSRFITAKKSDQLLKKLSTLTSHHQGAALQRSVLVASRIKNMNETIFYLVDELNRAIHQNVSVSFHYYDWVLEGQTLQRRPRHEGRLYTVSPWQLLWQDEFYYLIAFDHAEGAIRHYRVDRMGEICQTAQKRLGKEAFDARRTEDYTARVFGMFGGESRAVTLAFPEHLLGAMIDRFGKNAAIRRKDGTLTVRGEIVPSLHFFGWLFSLGEEVSILEPTDLKEEFIAALKERIKAE